MTKLTSVFLRVEIVMLLWSAEICVRLFGFFRTAKLFHGLARSIHKLTPGQSAKHDPQVLTALVEKVSTSAFALPTRCISQSITLRFLLDQFGHQSEIRLGVQTLAGGFRAHAWVEHAGIELSSSPSARLFVPIANT